MGILIFVFFVLSVGTLTMSDVSRTFLYLYRWKVRGVGLDGEISKQPVRTQ